MLLAISKKLSTLIKITLLLFTVLLVRQNNVLTIDLYSSGNVGQLFYTVAFNSSLVDKAEVVPPTDFSLPWPVAVFKLPSVRVRSLMLSSAVKGSVAIAHFEGGAKKAWERKNPGIVLIE